MGWPPPPRPTLDGDADAPDRKGTGGRYPGSDDPTRRRRQALRGRHRRRPRARPRRARGRARRARRPVRLRQVDHAEDGQPADRADDRTHPAAGRGRHRTPTRCSCAAGWATSSSRSGSSRTRTSRPTWRPCRGCSAGTRSAIQARVTELLELVGLEPATLRQALPAPALRRSAAAGRRGPGPGRGPAGAADGRAVRRRRPDRARPAAGRVRAAAARGPQDRPVRHPRPRRGGAARRPDRGVPRRRPPRAVRRAAAHPGRPGHRLRAAASSAATAASSGCR